jgi:hypothetical protein
MRRRPRARAWATLALALALVAGLVAAAYANVGGFEGGDGDQVAANCAAALDWQCLSSSQYVAAIDKAAPNDDVFMSGSKETDVDHWGFTTGSVSGKTDVQAAWSYSSTNAAHDTNFLDLGFKRATGGGDSYLEFELNQSASKYVNSNNTSITCRTENDVIISYEISPSSAVTVNLYKWHWTGGTPCTKGATGTFLGPFSLSGQAELALNSVPITNYLSTGAVGTSFPMATFGEAAVNLSALADAVKPAATCEFFNHLQITSRSSVSLTSNMDDFLDSGPIAARACQSGGGGGGTPPSVHISAPADSTCTSAGTVTLTGTSDQSEVEVVDGTTAVGNAPVDGSGNWTLTLNGVADGSHSYSAVATDAAGTTTSNTVTVTVNSQGCGGVSGFTGGGGSTTGGSTTGGGNGNGNGPRGGAIGTQLAASCTVNRLVLTDVFPLGNRTRLLGVAPNARPGSKVAILSMWNHKVVATPTVQSDLSFSAAVRLPPTSLRLTNRARYVARSGGQTSLALKFARRLYDTRVVSSRSKVTFTGIVIKPLAKPVGKVVIRASRSCKGVANGAVVARVKPSSSGKFSVTFTLPKSLSAPGVVYLRAQTSVRKVARNRKLFPTFSLIRGVRAG